MRLKQRHALALPTQHFYAAMAVARPYGTLAAFVETAVILWF